MTTLSAYSALAERFTRLYRYHHLHAIASWDQATMMPAKGNEARAAALAELQVLIHRTLTEPGLAGQIAAAEDEPLDDMERANLREIRRSWEQANLLPEALVEAKALAGSRCEHAWRTQRPANDWPGFLANFREVVRLSREEAQRLAEATGVRPYDALMDKFEPGMSSAEIERVFEEVKGWLPGLIRQVRERQEGETVLAPAGPFAVERQRALGLDVMKLLGFDFDGGRLDVSVHPFCGGVAEDVRITTRYREDDFVQSLMGIVHETGHARYEQGLPRDWLSQPVGQARSMGIHESQSLSFEMQLGRSPAFLELIAPLVRRHLGEQEAFSSANLARLYTRVQPGFIRVDADELTYPAHIILRFEIERALIEGEIEAEDIPALWDEKMQAYLGVDTRGNFRDGCLQDIHWTDGSFGYFPSYTLGAMYAAQYFAALRRQQPDLDAQIAAGNLAPVFDWLDRHIWSQGSRWETGELVERATGEALNPAYFRAHLERRYLG
ncbi:carboxypeptidase M32 [Pseudogulbenkiania ferrooxidans]|uniref:Metal-dependent carboxypeptidase n=1 Tax=Pseudogulbenkiania ferrooxidans 2002 TaxID=279714 RepID=B9Z107_9NEIS|nr:carboxypeptidase M32 [Pseudogulbenkiania ferrooxidans]EEG09102.1 Carboxypeptidase Taq [Pseudogulbenkiania ferrooxidans 2002]